MDTFSRNTGIISSLIAILCIVVWFVSFVVIAGEGELFYWTDAQTYLRYVQDNDQFFENLAKAFMLIFSLAFLVLHFTFVEMDLSQKGLPSKLGMLFISFFGLLSAAHYFTQISMVRLSILKEETVHLEAFMQANPLSFSSTINMLGWTLMLGLASLFFYFHFKKTGIQRWLSIFHFLNFIFCFAALIGFLTQFDPLTFIAINFGVGACITAISILGFIKFLKYGKSTNSRN